MPNLREPAVRWLYRLGWKYGSKLPAPVVRAVGWPAARLVLARNGFHIRTLRHNLTLAAGRPVTHRLMMAALMSYLRNFAEVMALSGWSRAEILRRVSTTGEDQLRQLFASRGAVVALPHSGNWDLAGAWACLTGMPVTTVAEQLADEEFRAFTGFREGLGMEILSHRDPGALASLTAAIGRGRLVCLIADRDLTGSGVPVSWRGQPVTMPAGPAMVARRSGAVLLPAVCQFTGSGMIINIGPPIESRPGRQGLIEMTQQVADYFAELIADQPQDWHLMQPFFPDSGGAPR